MASFAELLSGVLRFFPNTMIITLLVVGTITGKLSWIVIALGGVLLAIAVLTLQYVFGKVYPAGNMPGSAIMEACSLLPAISATAVYTPLPSLWIALSSYFLSYIFVNAMRVYTATPANAKNNALPVVQRKGIGLISMLAVVVLFIFLMVPRYRTGCESRLGTVLGLAAGVSMGWVWWNVLDACGSDVFPDIHGVLMGIKPGTLHTAPVACTPA